MSRARDLADIADYNIDSNLTFGDNDKALFGAGSDLQIYSDGANAVINHSNTLAGALYLMGDNNVIISNQAGTENKATFTTNGAVTLYYANAAKLATTATGVDVTGTLDITGAGGGSGVAFKTTDASLNETFYIQDGGRVGVRYTPFTVGIPRTTSPATNAIFQVEEAGYLTVLNSGNVGIGTTSPSALLHLDGTTPSIFLQPSADTEVAAIRFRNAADSNTQGMIEYNHSENSMSFRTNGVSDRLFIDSSGQVLIGTSVDHSSQLTLGNNGGSKLVISGNGNIGSEVNKLEFRDRHNATYPEGQLGSYIYGHRNTTGVEHYLTFGTTNVDADATERMRIHADGDVSIIQGYLYFGAVTNTSQFVRGGGLSGTQLIVGSSSGGFYHQVGSNYYLVTTSGGSTSDETLKENVTPITSAVDKIKQLNGVYFNFIEDPQDEANKGLQIGVIAQNIEQQFPEIVVTDDDGIKSVRYEKLVAPLIEAVKEQQSTIESLMDSVSALETRLAALEAN